MKQELLADGHRWLRIADPWWKDPLDPTYAQRLGGRWNPPDSFATLYLNEDMTTARVNLRAFVDRWPYQPEDLRADAGPILVAATLPRRQEVADVHSAPGVAAAGLPASYPLDSSGTTVARSACQAVGAQVHRTGLRGVLCRSANAPRGAGRELAWFPATARSRAKLFSVTAYQDWLWDSVAD